MPSIIGVRNQLLPVIVRSPFSTNAQAVKFPKNLLKKPVQPLSEAGSLEVERISLSMKLYLDAAKKQAELLKEKREEFQLGKRHLANLMGVDHNQMTQEDIDHAIEYLFPTGLFSKRMRPVMWPPEMVYPKLKAANFDYEGRPLHCFAYTRMPLFYQAMHDIAENYDKCNQIEDKMIAQGVIEPAPESRMDLSGTRWKTLEELKSDYVEKITPKAYASFLYGINRLADHSYSSVCKDFLTNFQIPLDPDVVASTTGEPTYTEDGRCYVTIESKARMSRAIVRVWANGTGKFTVNGHDILYFPALHNRKQIIFPLVTSKMLGKVDIEADAWGPGIGSQAVAIRCGISFGLVPFIDEATKEEMRLAGLLRFDTRYKERSKPGKTGARRSGAWRPR